MIDLQNKLVFIHIPKCGGSSLETILTGRDDIGAHDVPDYVLMKNSPEIKKYFPLLNSPWRHGTLKEYELWLKDQNYDPQEFTYLSLIRHPVSLFYSHYGFRLKMKSIRTPFMKPFRRFVSELISTNVYIFFINVLFRKILYIMGRREYGRFISLFDFYLRSGETPPKNVQVFCLEDIGRDSSALIQFLRSKGYEIEKFGSHNKSSSSRMLRSKVLDTLLSLVFRAEIKYWEKTRVKDFHITSP